MLSFTLVGGMLTVTGTTGKDSITLKLSNGQIALSDDGVVSHFSAASITSIQISAGSGNDHVTSDPGITVPTTILGGPGNDSLVGGGGGDFLSGAGGNDTMDGGLGADTMFGGSGIDTVTYASRTNPVTVTIDDASNDGEAGEKDDVGSGVENVIGGSGDDNITGSSGANYLQGGPGNDTLSGAAGNDTIDGGLGADSMSGGPGFDTVTYASRTNGVNVQLGVLPSTFNGEVNENDTIDPDFETIIGGSGNDNIVNAIPFASLPNLLIEGGPGNDTLEGSYGDDTVLGQAGNDYILHSHGNDVLDGGAGINTVDMFDPFEHGIGARVSLDGIANDGYGTETQNVLNFANINGGEGDDTLIGDAQNNVIDGGGGANNLLEGGAGNDLLTIGSTFQGGGTLIGGDGNDTLQGGLASEIKAMIGGPGDDVLFPGAATTTVTGDAGNDVADWSGDPIGIDTNLAGTGLETIIGTQLNDTIIGSDQNDVIFGLSGSDSIEGNGGDDYIDGGTFADTLMGGDGNDIIVNADGGNPDLVDGGPGFDLAEFDGTFGTPPHEQPNDTLLNIEFIYDPEDGVPQPGQALGSLVASPNAAAIVGAGGSLVGGVLTIDGQTKNGSPMADNISVILDSTGTNISVTEDGVSKTYPLASVRSITIDSGGGNDNIALARSDGTRAIPIPVSVLGGAGNDTITGGSGNDSIFGGDGNDSIHGGAGNDSLEGDLGNDTLNGDAGDDNLNGGTEVLGQNNDGADKIFGGAGNDSVIYSFRTDNLYVDISDGTKNNDGAPGEGDNVAADVENVFGGNGNDTIVGNAASNVICGGGGNDSIEGGDGNDKLIGSRGNDTVLGQGGINLYSVADRARDDIDVALDSDGNPINAFVSGDPGVDFSTISQQLLSVPKS
jgi:Ca2+-binding RTX toxin-like protein